MASRTSKPKAKARRNFQASGDKINVNANTTFPADLTSNKLASYIKETYGNSPSYKHLVEGIYRGLALRQMGLDPDVKSWGSAVWVSGPTGTKVTFSQLTALEGTIRLLLSRRSDDESDKATTATCKINSADKDGNFVTHELVISAKSIDDEVDPLLQLIGISKQDPNYRAALNNHSSMARARTCRIKAVLNPNSSFAMRKCNNLACYPYTDGHLYSASTRVTQLGTGGACSEFEAVYAKKAEGMGNRSKGPKNQATLDFWERKVIEPFRGPMKGIAAQILKDCTEQGASAVKGLFYQCAPLYPPRISALTTSSLAAQWFSKAKAGSNVMQVYGGIKEIVELCPANDNPWLGQARLSMEFAAVTGNHHLDVAGQVESVYKSAVAGWATLLGFYGAAGTDFALGKPFFGNGFVVTCPTRIPETQAGVGQSALGEQSGPKAQFSFAGRVSSKISPNQGVLLRTFNTAGQTFDDLHKCRRWLESLKANYKAGDAERLPTPSYLVSGSLNFTGNDAEVLNNPIWNEIRGSLGIGSSVNGTIYAAANWSAGESYRETRDNAFKDQGNKIFAKFRELKLAAIKNVVVSYQLAENLQQPGPILYEHLISFGPDTKNVFSKAQLYKEVARNYTYTELREAGFPQDYLYNAYSVWLHDNKPNNPMTENEMLVGLGKANTTTGEYTETVVLDATFDGSGGSTTGQENMHH